MSIYYRYMGRVYEVQAMPGEQQANAFMAANPGYGVLDALPSGVVLLAAMDSRGVAVNDLQPDDLRAAVRDY